MIKELLRDDDTLATPIILYLVDNLGIDALEYEPETIAEYLTRIEPKTSRRLLDRVNAGLGLFTSDLFWTDPIIFGVVCRALNRKSANTGSEPELDDIVWGVHEAQLLLGDPEETTARFSDSIVAFVHYMFKLNGVYSMPKSLIDWFGDVPFNLPIDDPTIAEARQAESDEFAAELDAAASQKMMNCLKQISVAGIDIIPEARSELDQIINGKGDNDAAN